jgi:hypothetical protein
MIMANISARRSVSGESYWREQIGLCEALGKSITQYCRDEGLSVAKCHLWKAELPLDNGHFESTGQLAVAVKNDPSYVARVLRLATLTPDITQAVLDSREPDGLSYMKLVKVLSYDWEEQCEALGFT